MAEIAETYLPLSPSLSAAVQNFAGGAVASLVTQSVIVPIDVVSQRLMVAGMLDPTICNWQSLSFSRSLHVKGLALHFFATGCTIKSTTGDLAQRSDADFLKCREKKREPTFAGAR